MITLHGFPYSNYYNIVKHVLLHKNIPFEEDIQYGGTDAYLELSPVGKIPSLTTEQGANLSESSVCCDYLEETYPDIPLYPTDNTARAEVRQAMRISELYLELPCRRLLPFMLSRTEAPAIISDDVRVLVGRGVGAINRISSFDPYLKGADISMADIYLRYVMMVVDMVGKTMLDWDIGADINGLKEWQQLMADSDESKTVDADFAANEADFFAMVEARIAAASAAAAENS